jgi:hypothetical protein
MAIGDKNRLYDGFSSLEAGVDAGRAPVDIDVNQCVQASNLVFRGGHPTTRPGIRKLTQSYQDLLTEQLFCYNQRHVDDDVDRIAGEYAEEDEVSFPLPPYVTSSEQAYKSGKMQCALAYSPHGGEDCLMVLVGGRLFKVIPGVTKATVTEVRIDDGDEPRNLHNNPNLPIGYMTQADKWFLAQDGESRCIIYNANLAKRAKPRTGDREHTEVPTGTMMTYGMGRVVVVVNERDVAFGDLYGSHDLPDPADSLIFFSERNFLAEGFDAAIPFERGLATGSMFFPQLDTSTGNGQLLVFAERGAASFFLSLPRDQWKESAFQQLALLTTGLRGHRSISAVNEDLWFRADDGFRSYRQARSEPHGYAHIPLSTNVKQFLDVDTGRLLRFASSIYFDNRVIATCSPVWNQGRPYHENLVAVDFDIVSSFGTANRPAWEGTWPKLKVTQVVSGIFNGVTRAFAFGIDENNENQLYEFTTADKDDFDGKILWDLESKAFDFVRSQTSTSFNENEVYDADLWIRDVSQLEFLRTFYRPDNFPEWLPWKAFEKGFSQIGRSQNINAGGVPTARPGFIPRLSLGKPPDRCDSQSTKRGLRRGYQFQILIRGKGHAVIDRFRIHGQKLTERATANNPPTQT